MDRPADQLRQGATSYARAAAGYDEDFERHLAGEIMRAITEASLVTDANIMALRLGETLKALTSCLVSFAASSPHFDTPSHLREFAETLAKRVRREVARGRAEGFGGDFIFSARQGSNA